MLKARLTKIGGDSLGLCIPRAALQQLRWFQGDKLLLEVTENTVTVTNFNKHTVAPALRQLDYGDSVTRRT